MPSNVEMNQDLVDRLMADSIGKPDLDDEQLTEKSKNLVYTIGRYTICRCPG